MRTDSVGGRRSGRRPYIATGTRSNGRRIAHPGQATSPSTGSAKTWMRTRHCPVEGRAECADRQAASQSVPDLLSDYVNTNSGYALIVGGNWNNGSNAGLSYLNNWNGNSNNNIGARLTRPAESDIDAQFSNLTVSAAAPLGGTVKQTHGWLVARPDGRSANASLGLSQDVVG